MFKDTTHLLKEENYEPVPASKDRVWTLIKRNKKIMVHIILHHVIQLILLVVGFSLVCCEFFVHPQENGKLLSAIAIGLSGFAFVVYLFILAFMVMAVRTHPVFTLLTDVKRPNLFVKLANLFHTLYMIALCASFFTAIVVSISFDAVLKKNFSMGGLYVVVIVDIIYLQLSCGELQKPFKFITRKIDQVEMGDKTDDKLQDQYKEDVGVITYGYNLLGFQCYLKYHFDPNEGHIQSEVYFVGWVKNFN
ncbi:hypothetical protein EIN_150950 [Entamoeba invadens IP1]|uniref:Uncharacterized protein n=1 Tax=Entamoeba invadens IP1 TaxID=370355 RepID=A0A0A1UBY1_ENTIV|nr:hypothetical protein EIN_150950 [Entamoeba invadens IP1]ELP91218.1 hypothetical protein EIN_150950 [Entamoeba invadens IP1]|eukprot:XP_004257989.1 hypothetical protein EIN_150950 [Entamoeba invadens IP1]